MGLTRIRAEQISDIDYKQAVRVITLTNVTLSGGAPSSVDGVNLVKDDRILVAGQDTGSQNGIYQVQTVGAGSNGTWIRSIDTNQTGELEAGTIVMVTEGNTYADTQWKLTTNNPIIIGTTALVFEQNSAFAFGNVYANGTAVLATSVGDSLTLTAGNNISITGNNASKTVTIGVTGISLSSIANGTSNVNIAVANGNVTTAVSGNTILTVSDAGANVTGYVTATGNVSGGNLTTAGQVTATGNITGGNLLINNNAVITGNLTVNGTETIFNVQTLSVNDKDIIVANNVTGGANVNGAGIQAGNPAVATWLFNNATTSWQSNIGITPTANSTLNLGGTSNYWNVIYASSMTMTGNANVGNIGATRGVFTNVVGTLETAAQTNITSVGTLTSLAVTGNITSGNVSGTRGVFTNVVGTLETAAQPNITSVGNLTSLNVTGNANVGNIGATNANLSAITVTGNANVGNLGTTAIVATGAISGSTTLSITGNANVGNLGTAGLITATGNVTGGNLNTGGQVVATGNVTGNFFVGKGSALTGINSFGNIAISGETTVSADNTSDTLTLVQGLGISILTDAANNSITIGTSQVESIFVTGGDMGTVIEAVTDSEDLGTVDVAADTQIDMGTIVTAGIFYPDQLVLPSYTVAELGNVSASPAAQMAFCSNESGGAVPVFSDGTNWRRVTDRAIVT